METVYLKHKKIYSKLPLAIVKVWERFLVSKIFIAKSKEEYFDVFIGMWKESRQSKPNTLWWEVRNKIELNEILLSHRSIRRFWEICSIRALFQMKAPTTKRKKNLSKASFSFLFFPVSGNFYRQIFNKNIILPMDMPWMVVDT